MSRREEVEALGNMFHTEENWNAILYERCRTLADEVDAANATLDALRGLCGPNKTISNSTCMKMVDILYPLEPRT